MLKLRLLESSLNRFLTCALVMFPIASFFDISFYDEAFVAICLLLFLIKRPQLSRIDKTFIILLFISYIIGFISNMKSGIINNWNAIVLDAFAIYKPFVAFFTIRYLVNSFNKYGVVYLLSSLSKIWIIVVFFLAFVSQFLNIGMTEGQRYGIKAFTFVYDNPSIFGITTIIALINIATTQKRNNILLFYFLMACLSLLLTTKGIFISFIIFTILIYFFNREGKLKFRNIILLGFGLLLVSSYQIETYLKNSESPRMVFLYNGVKVANDYFPIGSGFATFGSEEAKRAYSKLYYKYGFDSLWGMNEEDGQFLNDNYWAMILGQLGYIGFATFFCLLFCCFKVINEYRIKNKVVKSMLLSSLLMMYVTSVATGVTKSLAGVYLFSYLGLMIPNKNFKYARNIKKSKDYLLVRNTIKDSV